MELTSSRSHHLKIHCALPEDRAFFMFYDEIMLSRTTVAARKALLSLDLNEMH